MEQLNDTHSDLRMAKEAIARRALDTENDRYWATCDGGGATPRLDKHCKFGIIRVLLQKASLPGIIQAALFSE